MLNVRHAELNPRLVLTFNMAMPVVQAPLPLTEAQVAEMTRHVLQLTSSDSGLREAALLELSKKREDYADLPPLLWFVLSLFAVCSFYVVLSTHRGTCVGTLLGQ
jgi:hypothetical protein